MRENKLQLCVTYSFIVLIAGIRLNEGQSQEKSAVDSKQQTTTNEFVINEAIIRQLYIDYLEKRGTPIEQGKEVSTHLE